MRHPFASVLLVLVSASFLIAGCAQTAPAPTPTKAPAAPPKATSPTAAPAQPAKAPAAPTTAPTAPPATAAPAKKVDFPVKGRAISVIMPVAASGATDVGGRLLAAALEKDLGTPVQVVNKTAGGGQEGFTELAKAKPDGYTLGYTTLPTVIGAYLDPERKAAFGRKDFQPVAQTAITPCVVVVKSDSPYKSFKDLIDAAKANPEKVKLAAGPFLSSIYLAALVTEKVAGVQFAKVQFAGGAPNITALLGGHVDASSNTLGDMLGQYKSGEVRILGIADKEESTLVPGVKTLESQGHKIYMYAAHAVSAPAGTPREIVDLLSGTIQRAMASDDMVKKVTEMGLEVRYADPARYAAAWDEMEAQVKPLIESARKN